MNRISGIILAIVTVLLVAVLTRAQAPASQAKVIWKPIGTTIVRISTSAGDATQIDSSVHPNDLTTLPYFAEMGAAIKSGNIANVTVVFNKYIAEVDDPTGAKVYP